MNILSIVTHNFLSFVVILSIIVFIHEFGHYYVAKLCGVKVEEFAIGFGRELFGFNDKSGTRWKVCILPFGGYVKMFGDSNPASTPDKNKIKEFTADEKKVSFFYQNVYKRMAIVSAGPVANFILAILIFTIIFRIQGITTVLPIVDQVRENSAAYEAGIVSGDEILKIDNEEIEDFERVRQIISLSSDQALTFVVKRGEEQIEISVTPKVSASKDIFGNEIKVGMIGINASQQKFTKLNLADSFTHANIEAYNSSIAILKAIGELLTGRRSIKELGGPVKIAEYSGKSMSMGIMVVLWFMAMISINLGVANLLPLPVLDGGHLLFYIIEAIKGKPLSEKVQEYGFRFGFAVLLALMIFTTFNDVAQLFIK